jgi:hypothetical protein
MLKYMSDEVSGLANERRRPSCSDSDSEEELFAY